MPREHFFSRLLAESCPFAASSIKKRPAIQRDGSIPDADTGKPFIGISGNPYLEYS